MAPSARSGALTAGLILIAIGAIFLVETFYDTFSAWRVISRYWPVILIIVGVRKLYSYFSWQAIPPLPDKEIRKE